MPKPIIPWIGGKRRLASQILPLFPSHTCYVEPFAGAAALYFMRPSPAKVEVLNDVNGDLVNLYRVVQHHLEEFVRQFKWALTSRQMYEWLKATPTETLTDIQRAARFYYLQRQAFGAKIESRTFGTSATQPPKMNLLRIEESLSEAHLRLSRTYIENLPWQACVDKYDRAHTLFYLDPPYWQTEGYGVDFGWAEYETLADRLGRLKGKGIVSLNDHPDIRRCFRGFRMKSTDIQYTVGGGKGIKSREVLIFNWT